MQEITQIIKKDMVPALGVTEPGAIAFAVAKAKTTFVHHLLKLNGEKIISADAKKTASLLCNGAIEARVLGLNYPAMSITGSGAHGIMATLPLYAEYAVKGLSEEKLLRATVLSFLICMYIKAYSGRLSALCGCAIAGGTGAACGLCYLRGGGEAASGKVIDNMASGLTGMICDGGNQGCVMKGIAACEMAYNCADLALAGVYVDSVHGINGRTPEETMRNIGLIASPGMTQTEKTIVDIQQSKGYTEIKNEGDTAMNKRERVTAAFKGQETDHVAVCMWKHVPPSYWGDDDAFAAYQAKFLHDTDVDFMKLSGDKYFGWPAPILKEIENPANLYQMKPLGPNHPYIRGQIERTKKVVKALENECPAIYLIFAPLSYIRLQIGYPKMMRFIRENPEAMKYACRTVAEDVKLLVQGIIQESGADGIFFSAQCGEINRFTAEEYADWVAPSDRMVLDYANTLSDMNAIHFCAWEEVPNRLSVWKDYKAPVVSWSRYFDIMDIQEAKKHFGCTVWGGFDNRPGSFLYTADRAAIEREVESLIAMGGKSGYILGSDCSIHDELPEEKIRWVVEKARAI